MPFASSEFRERKQRAGELVQHVIDGDDAYECTVRIDHRHASHAAEGTHGPQRAFVDPPDDWLQAEAAVDHLLLDSDSPTA